MSRKKFLRSVLMALLLACAANCGWTSRSSAQDSGEEVFQELRNRGDVAEEVGRIKRNTNSRTDAPYSLVDKWGTVRYYLQPGEGLDLEPYLNRVIRVQGDANSIQNESVQVLEVQNISLPENNPPRVMPTPERQASARERQPERRMNNYDRRPAPRMEPRREMVEQEHRHPRGGQQHPVRQSSYQDALTQPLEEVAPSPLDRQQGNMRGAPMDNSDLEPIPHHFEEDDIDLMPNCAGCGSCQGCRMRTGCERPCCDPCPNGSCPTPGMTWIRAEYLYWWTKGMHLPPLVTTGPDATQPGFLGSPGTEILFGANSVNGFGRSGVRVNIGTWLNVCQTFGVEADYFGLVFANTNFFAASDPFGSPIISRPFFDTRGDLMNQNVEIVSSPGILAGSIDIRTSTSLQSAGVHGLFNLCCKQSCNPCSSGCGMNGPSISRVDLLLGYRYMTLSDRVSINENLNTLNVVPAVNFLVNDSFVSQNQFHGAEIGTKIQRYRGRWSLDLLTKIAIGNVTQTVTINGATAITQAGSPTTTFPGGLLAQQTNIGRYSRNDLGLIPELGATMGYQITPRLRATLGYTFMFWANVARAGEQIDFNVNSNYLPGRPAPTVPFGDPRNPLFAFHETSFWAQGVNTGLDFRF